MAAPTGAAHVAQPAVADRAGGVHSCRPKGDGAGGAPRAALWGGVLSRAVLWLLALVVVAPPASAHALLHRVLDADSMVRAEFYFPDGDRPYFESYRIMAPDDHRPFQSGRVNAAGEVSFRPDRPGLWRIVVATEDGHGAELRVRVGADDILPTERGLDGLSRWERLIASIGYLLGVFGIIAFWRMRRAGKSPA